MTALPHHVKATHMDKADLLDALNDREKSHTEEAVKQLTPIFDGKKRGFLINGSHSTYDTHLFTQLANQLEAPAGFLRSTDEAMVHKVVKHLQKNVKGLSLVMVDGKVASSFEKKLPYTSPVDVATQVLDEFKDFDQVELHTTADRVELGFRSNTALAEPAVGDIVKGGVNLRFSDYGIIQPEVETASYRLVCTNGMVHSDFNAKIQVTAKNYQDLIAKIKESVAAGVKIFNDVVNPRIAKSSTVEIDPMQAIRRMAVQNRLDVDTLSRVMAAYALEPTPTMWGVSNAFTRAANLLPHSQRTRLQHIGGDFVRTANHAHCTTCAALL